MYSMRVPYRCLPSLKIWGMSGLRFLDMDVPMESTERWSAFCDLLNRSPLLEVCHQSSLYNHHGDVDSMSSTQALGVPLLRVNLNSDTGKVVTMPKLVHLRRIAFYNMCPALLNIDGHLSIVEMSYRDLHGTERHAAIPRLPAIRCMLNIRGSHVSDLLRRYHECGDTLPLLETLTLDYNPLILRNWADLSLILSTSLRVLHIRELVNSPDESRVMLNAMAAAFPNLEELHLPADGSRYRISVPSKKKISYPSVDTPRTVEKSWKPHLYEVIGRLPRLRSVVGVEFFSVLEELARRVQAFGESGGASIDDVDIKTFLETSRALTELRRKYPHLCAVNGWRLNIDLTKEAVLTFQTASDWGATPEIHLVLTRESVRLKYSGTLLDSQPLPLDVKRPRPIPRTLWRGIGD